MVLKINCALNIKHNEKLGVWSINSYKGLYNNDVQLFIILLLYFKIFPGNTF